MAGQEMTFDEARAQSWKSEVEIVLQRVDALLRKVAEVCRLGSSEDDTILNTLHQTGEVLSEAWDVLTHMFLDIIANFANIIKGIANFVAEAAQHIADWANGVQH